MVSLYKIANNINSKIYIGFTTKTLEKRWYDHCNAALANRYDFKFSRAIRKHGVANFTITLLENAATVEDGLKREKELIAEYNSITKGYNTHESGRGGNTGAYHKVGRKGALNHMFRKHHSEEVKLKQKAGKQKWLLTDEGKAHTEGRRQYFLTDNPGKVKSDQMIQRLSESQKKRLAERNQLAIEGKINDRKYRWFTLTHPNTTMTIHAGLRNIANTYNLNFSCLTDTLNGRQSNHRGYKIRYATDEEIKNHREQLAHT